MGRSSQYSQSVSLGASLLFSPGETRPLHITRTPDARTFEKTLCTLFPSSPSYKRSTRHTSSGTTSGQYLTRNGLMQSQEWETEHCTKPGRCTRPSICDNCYRIQRNVEEIPQRVPANRNIFKRLEIRKSGTNPKTGHKGYVLLIVVQTYLSVEQNSSPKGKLQERIVSNDHHSPVTY